MSATLLLKRTLGTSPPNIAPVGTGVSFGELVYTYDTSDVGAGKSYKKLYIGNPAGPTATPIVIGGEYYTSLIPESPANYGNREANKALILDSNAKVKSWSVVTDFHNAGVGTNQGDFYVGGNLNVTGDIVYDEVNGRNLNISGVATVADLGVTGLSTAENFRVGYGASIHEHGGASFAGIVTFGNSILPNADNSIDLGATGAEFKDLFIDGTANIDSLSADTAAIGDLTDNRVVIAGSSGELEDDANLTFDGEKFNVGSGVTIQPHGGVSIAGITTIGGNLFVKGDITYDEITGRNLNITGITTFADVVNVNGDVNLGNATSDTITATGRFDSDIVPSTDGARDLGASGLEFKDLFIDGTAHIDTLDVDEAATVTTSLSVGSGVTAYANGNVAAAGIVTANGGVKVGSAITLATNGNLAVTGILTAKEFVGVFTSAGGAGVGIGSTTGLVGYGFTFINFKGPGVSTVFASSTTGIATIFFQGGGSSVGAAGTWQNDQVGISTAKSVGVNTSTLDDADLQGRPHVGAAGSFQGLYIGNGMIVNDNQLNGDHYIGTAFGGMMAGPVTINGVLTVDGSYVVV